jgi:hypothetical protein
LILIKAGANDPVRVVRMSQDLPPLRPCPRCKITMQAERSDIASDYDTFTCLRCDLVLTYRRPQREAAERNEERR